VKSGADRLKSRVARVVVLLLVLTAATVPAYACEYAFREYTVSLPLAVNISYAGLPLSGIDVQVSPDMDPLRIVATIRSDKDGHALIKALGVGKYLIVTKHAGIEGDAAILNVKAKRNETNIPVDLKWPSQSPFKVRKLAGTLMRTKLFKVAGQNGISRVQEPLSSTNIRLTEALSEVVLGEWPSDGQGSFAFNDVRPGLYILHVSDQLTESRLRIDGDVFVEIVPDAKEEKMPDLGLYMSDCGLELDRINKINSEKPANAQTH
jgi:hypothetical protein